MKPLFRWRTEEDEFWTDEPPATAVPRRKDGLLIWFIGLTLAGIGVIYWRQIRPIRLEEAQLQAEVLASHRTWEQAAAANDFDLFAHLLAHEDLVWQNEQRELFLKGLSLDRAALGLYAQAEPGNTAVALSPDWQTAEVIFEQTYTAVTEHEIAATIQLQQTHLYQRDGSRWLQAAPDDAFWGETLTYEGEWLTLLYPTRDAEWAERLASDLDDELTAICAVKSCAAGVKARLETAPASLAALRDLLTPAFDGRFHILPAFSLIGRPLDEEGYQALYRGYTRRIVVAFQNNLDLPFPFPEQAIQTICFPRGGTAPRLFRYDLAADAWTNDLPERTFRFLTPLPDDSGLIISELPATAEATRMKLSLWRAGEETALFDDANRVWRFPPIGWSRQAQRPRLLINEFDRTTRMRPLFSWLDLLNCDESGCATADLPGYTVWSPEDRSSLIVVGLDIALGDETGQPYQTIGPGSNPFWLDETHYGYIRYSPQIEIVAATTVATTTVAATAADESPQVLLNMEDLTAVLDDPETGFPAISHVIPHPAIPGLLFLTGLEMRGSSGKYNIFSFQVADDWGKTPAGTLTLRLQLDEPPLGYPALLTPSGIPPISFSSDGRYLVAAHLTDPPNDIWRIHLHDIVANQTQIVTVGSPHYPSNTPFYDWSQDGQWLVAVDDGFFKLVAPAANYERLILHDFDACHFTAWVD
ncbi:MAG: hypothetical protein GY803_02030 [Chloroflexi bacterium]|nr:hypothetical protein [Chloroflexota bacterium]